MLSRALLVKPSVPMDTGYMSKCHYFHVNGHRNQYDFSFEHRPVWTVNSSRKSKHACILSGTSDFDSGQPLRIVLCSTYSTGFSDNKFLICKRWSSLE